MNEFITKNPTLTSLSLIVLVSLFFLFSKKILWYFFKFDREVAKIIHQQKSSEVRVGKVVESIAPFLDNFPVDIHAKGSSTQFLGQPIDFIHFTEEGEVIFIEVKSGSSQLSAFQRKIKSNIEQGNVQWAEYRVK